MVVECSACNDEVETYALLPCFHVLCLACANDDKEQQQHCPFPVAGVDSPLVCGETFKHADLLFVDLARAQPEPEPEPDEPQQKRLRLSYVTLTDEQQNNIDGSVLFLTNKSRLLGELVALLRSRRADAETAPTTSDTAANKHDEVVRDIDANIKAVELVRDGLAVLLEHFVCAKRLVDDETLPEHVRAAALARLLAIDDALVCENDIPVETTPRLQANGDVVHERIYPPSVFLQDASDDDLSLAKYRVARDFTKIRQPRNVIRADMYKNFGDFAFCVSSQGYIVAASDEGLIVLTSSGDLVRRIPMDGPAGWLSPTSDGCVWAAYGDCFKFDVTTGQLFCRINFGDLGLPSFCDLHALTVTPDDRVVLFVNSEASGSYLEQPPLIMLDANGRRLSEWCLAETYGGGEPPSNFSGFSSCTATNDHLILTYENGVPNILKYSLLDGSFAGTVNDDFLSESYWLIAHERTSDLTFFRKRCDLRACEYFVDIIAKTSYADEDDNAIEASFAGFDYYADEEEKDTV